MEKDKTSFLHELFKALEAEDHDTNPPPGGEAEDSALKGFTYIKRSKGWFPQKPQETPKGTFVGAPTLPSAKQAVDVCKADGNGPQKLLELLQEIGRSLLPYGNRELWRKVGTIVFLLPLEMAALHLGVSRQTVHAWKKKLEEKGLVATDTLHQKLPNGEYRAIGTLWAVRLRPGKARLTLDDYMWPWRNLAVDMANGILSFTWVKAYQDHGIRPTLDTLVLWATGKRVTPNTKTVAVDLGLILVLPEVEDSKRPMLITLLSTYLANLFDDHRSRRFYAGLMWAVARGEISAQYVFALLTRVLRDYMEGFLTRPGACVVKSLKKGS